MGDFFQPVFLKCAQGVNNSKHICARIFFRIDCWNRGDFEKLVKVTFNAAMGHLGKARGIQSEEQYHSKFSNLVLKGKLREVVTFVCARETRGFATQKIGRGYNDHY